MGSGGKKSSNVYRASDYYSPELNALQNSIYSAIAPTSDESLQTDAWKNSAFGKAWGNMQQNTATANNMFNSAVGNVPTFQGNFNAATQNMNSTANAIRNLGNNTSYDTSGIRGLTDKITGLGDSTAALQPSVSDQMGANNKRINNLADKIEGVGDTQGDLAQTIKGFTETGNIPQEMLNNLNHNVNTELNRNTGSALNDLAARGVMNSSVANRSINSLSNAAADAYAKNYLEAYNSVLGGYRQTNDTLASQGDTYSKAISGYDTSNKNIQDLTNQQLAIANAAGNLYNSGLGGEQAILAAQQKENADKLSAYNAALSGYGGLADDWAGMINQNNAAIDQYAKLPSVLSQAMSDQFSPAYNLWKDWTKNVNDGTVVTESSGGK